MAFCSAWGVIKLEQKDKIDTNQNKEHHSSDHEEISFDFSKIKQKTKKFWHSFKSNEQKDHTASKEDEVAIDFRKVGSFFKTSSKWLIPLILIILVVTVSSYFRMLPAALTVTDDWAENQVQAYYQEQIAAQVEQQYPNLPAANKQVIIDRDLNQFLSENEEMIQQQIEATSQQFKARLQDDSGQTYLSDIDSYYWYAEAGNYLEYGALGDMTDENGNRRFSLRNGREGLSTTDIPLHPIFGAWTYKLVHFFNKDVSLMGVFCMLSAILIGLAIIPAFFIGKRLAGNVGGFFAALIIAINSSLLSRSTSRTADTDPHNILFPLLILWMFILLVDTKDLKKKIIYGLLGGVFAGLYVRAWLGYWYSLDFILITIAVYLVYQIIMHFKELKWNFSGYLKVEQFKNILYSGLIFVCSTGLMITIFAGFNKVLYLFQAPLKTITMKQVAVSSLWPNVLTTVAEFNTNSLSAIISEMGGKLLFWLALCGLVLFLTKDSKKKAASVWYLVISAIYYFIILGLSTSLNKPLTFMVLISLPIVAGLIKNLYYHETENEIKYSVLFIIWIAATAYGYTKGVRFAILMVPAFALAFGILAGLVYNYLSEWSAKNLHLHKIITKIVVVALLCLLLITPLRDANALSSNEVPMMNDAWYDSLLNIKDNYPQALITSWWDFGHWFFAISERQVTFDGANQGEKIYWVGKSLLTPDEKVSVGLLRMLNCGQQKPVHVLEEFFDNDTIKAVDVMNQMMYLNDKKAAIKLLGEAGLTTTQIAEVIKITYCDDLIPQLFITSEDMIGKAGVWGHFGSWDFERAKMYQAVISDPLNGREILQTQFNLSELQAEEYYNQILSTEADQWIAPWPGYYGLVECTPVQDMLECQFDLDQGTLRVIINTKTMEAEIPAQNDEQPYHLNSLVYATAQEVKEKFYEDRTVGLSAVLIPESNQILIAHPLQANSLFTRLFYLNGHGLNCFKKFDERQQLIGGKIQVWEVDFDCQQQNKVYFLPKDEPATATETTATLESTEQVKASHILIATENREAEEALALINDIKGEVTTANFAELAQQYSDCPSAAQGGDLGWFGPGEMVQEFEEVAFSLKPGQISEPVLSQFGYHLIYVTDKKLS